MIRRFLIWLGLSSPEQREETHSVIAAARKEVDASRRARESLTDDDLRRLRGMSTAVKHIRDRRKAHR